MPYSKPELKRANDRKWYQENAQRKKEYVKEWRGRKQDGNGAVTRTVTKKVVSDLRQKMNEILNNPIKFEEPRREREEVTDLTYDYSDM